MKLHVEIELGNDAMQSASDAAHAAFKSIMRKAMSEHGPLADGVDSD